MPNFKLKSNRILKILILKLAQLDFGFNFGLEDLRSEVNLDMDFLFKMRFVI